MSTQLSNKGVVKPQKIDALEQLTQMNYSQWKTQLLNFLKTNRDFIHFLDPGKTWTCLYDDPTRSQTGEDIKKLDSLMIILATYGPASLSDEIINFCTSVKNYFDRICEFLCIQNTAASSATIFHYNRKRKGFKHDGNQSYQDFYLDLRATRYQVLMNKDSIVKHAESASDTDVMMTPVIECSVVLDWLDGIDKRLVGFVEQKFATQLQTCTLYDLQNEISQHIDSFLNDMATPNETGVNRDVEDNLFPKLNEDEIIKYESTSDSNLWLDKVKALCSLTDDDIKNVASINSKVEKFVANCANPTIMHNPNRVKPYECDICGRLFKEKVLVRLHKKVHKEVQDFICDECPKTFTTNNGLEYHKLSHTGEKPFMCDQCPATFTTKWYCEKHKLIHTGEKPFQCDTCDKQFRMESDMKTHKKRAHGAKTNMFRNGDLPTNLETETYSCEDCSKTFIGRRYLKVHQNYCSGKRKNGRKALEKNHMCDICSKTFTGKWELKVHYMTHTGERPYICDECGKGFTIPVNLKIHKRIHSGERPFMCDKCPKAFISKRRLNIHKTSHSDQKPSTLFPCDLCGKSFKRIADLNRHKTIHDDTGERPFICDECGKGFRLVEILRKHQRIHTGEKPFVCDQCSRPFRIKRNMLRHKLIHSGEKPFKCDQCDEAFRHSHVLKAHTMVHSKESEQSYNAEEIAFTTTSFQ